MASEIKVRDIMKKDFVKIEKDATLMDAVIKMYENRIGSLIVEPSENREPFGIITGKDIIKAYADDKLLNKIKVGEISSSPLAVVSPGMPIKYAAKLMKKINLKHLAVFNGIDIVGVMSNADIVDAIAAEEKKKRRSK